MKKNIYLILVVLSVCTAASGAPDYAVDPTFNPTFRFSDFRVDQSIGDLIVQTDGKIIVGGTFDQVNGVASQYIARLNADGTVDPTFRSGLNAIAAGYVNKIKELPGGQFLVTGQFYIGTRYTSYARLNADGSVDDTLALAPIGQVIERLSDGKFVVCGGRQIGDEPFWISHRLNPDGTPDTSYRVTFGQGTCRDLRVLPDGKILIAGAFHNGNGFYYKPLQRLNPNGSTDDSFDPVIPATATIPSFAVQPDGKLLVAYSVGFQYFVQRLHPDGALDLTFENCAGGAFLPLSNGDVLMNGCRKWPTGHVFQFARLAPGGSVQPNLDWIDFNGTVNAFRSAADEKFYAYGFFSSVDGSPRRNLVRLMPRAASVKAKFDFDGDGKSDVSVFRPSDRYWYLSQSSFGIGYLQWGLATDKLIAADYDSDAKTDIAVFRNGVWYAFSSRDQYTFFSFGEPGDKPFAGDFDGDRKQDWATRRVRDNVVSWQVSTNSQRGFGYTTAAADGEAQADVPVIGDFDGDSRDEIGYFRNGVWYHRDYGSGAPTRSYQWGAAGDIPVPEDYDGDGQTDYAVFRPSTGVWWIAGSTQGWIIVRFGIGGDIPVPADYDGDGRTDIAIFRSGDWWRLLSGSGTVSAVRWGQASDVPIPAQTQRP